jgi:hypothetical protein
VSFPNSRIDFIKVDMSSVDPRCCATNYTGRNLRSCSLLFIHEPSLNSNDSGLYAMHVPFDIKSRELCVDFISGLSIVGPL